VCENGKIANTPAAVKTLVSKLTRNGTRITQSRSVWRSIPPIMARGGIPLTVQTSTWGGQAELDRLEAHNASERRVRCRIEKVFGTSKRSYGLRRMRWIGLAKAGLQTRLAAIAYNIRRSFGFVCAAAT
jgi:hypothetical protein